MTILERELERKLKEGVKARNGLCVKWISPGTTGLPDRIVLLPGARIAFVEMKRPKGSRVGALQSWWRTKLRLLGFRHYTIYTEAELLGFFSEMDKWEVRNE